MKDNINSKIKINEDFIESYLHFLNGLKKENDYGYYPVKNGTTYEGKNIDLGFSCFAIKSLYIIDEWKNITELQKNNWLNFINEFQNNVNKNFSEGSFIDINYLENITAYSQKLEEGNTFHFMQEKMISKVINNFFN